LATGQPDWGSVFIRYVGPEINHAGLLKYFISFRRHSGFAEHCAEEIFNDISNECHPDKLTVFCRYTRRGGLDINPFRSNFEKAPLNLRQIRQ
jgi:7-cyano-7-deazaguanine reductase